MLARFAPWLLVSLSTMLAPSLANAQLLGDELVDPEELHSPSGTWTLFIDPSSPRGEGPAKYRLSRGKEVAWTGELGCTLREVLLGDDGAFAGRAEISEGGLRLMLVGPDGKARFDASLPAEDGFVDGPSFPLSRGIVALREHDRVMFRIDHLEDSTTIEEWRPVRWSTGEALTSVRPEPPFTGSMAICSLNAVRPIARVPLLVCRWSLASFSDTPRGRASGARFVVTDFEAHSLWELDLPHDYEAGGDEKKADRVWDVCRESGLFDCAEPHRFEIQLVADAQRVMFEVNADEKASKGWNVREVGREDHVLELGERQEPKAKTAPPKLALEFLGATALQAGRPPADEFSGFDIDDRGRLGRVVSAPDAAPHFVLCDANGTLVSDVTLEIPNDPKEAPPPEVFWVQADRWFVHTHTWGEGEHVEAWWLDLPAGKLTALENFDCAPIKCGDGTFDGGFVVLTAESKPYTIETTLSRFDASGKLLWRDSEAYGNSEDGLFSAEDVRASPRGEIGVLDNIKHEIQRFDSKGKLVSAIELDKLLEHEASYPTELGVDQVGNWIVYDFNGSPPVLRVSRDGALTSTFSPHFGDGRVFLPKDGIHFAPDGRMWATDGYSLLRLDESGAVDQVAGEAPDATALGDVECSFVDPLGRIALADRRTHAVHVFDREGKRIALCNLAPNEVDEQTEVGCIAVSPEGNFHVGLGRFELSNYSVFNASGAHLGSEAFAGRSLFQPGKELRWAIKYDEIGLYDVDGAPLKKIARSPNNKWLSSIGAAGVAASGSLAVISRGGLHIYAPNGEPTMTIELPDGAGGQEIAFTGPRAFLGYGKKVWSFSLATRAVSEATLGQEISDRASARHFWRSDSGELWIIDEIAKRLLRYRVKS